MKRRIRQTATTATRLLRDEQGAEGLEKLLIIAAIVLPLLGLLIYYRNEIKDWVGDMWGEVRDDAEDFSP